MPAHHEEEIAQLTRGWTRGGNLAGEIKRLPGVLRDSEELVNLDRCDQGGRTGLLAATDARLVFLRTPRFRPVEIESYPYHELRSVKVEPQLFGGSKIVLELKAGEVKFGRLDGTRAERIVEYVEPRIGKTGPVPVPTERSREETLVILRESVGKVQAVFAATVLNRIADALAPGEPIGPGLVGSLGNTPGVLVATERRLLFAALDPRRPVEDWRYDEITEISVSPPAKLSTLNIETESVSRAVKTVEAARASAVSEHVQPRLGREEKPAVEPAPAESRELPPHVVARMREAAPPPEPAPKKKKAERPKPPPADRTEFGDFEVD